MHVAEYIMKSGAEQKVPRFHPVSNIYKSKYVTLTEYLTAVLGGRRDRVFLGKPVEV